MPVFGSFHRPVGAAVDVRERTRIHFCSSPDGSATLAARRDVIGPGSRGEKALCALGRKKKTFGRSVAVDKESERLAKHAEDANLDLVQLLSIVVMPTLARAGKEWILQNIDETDPGEMPVDDNIESSRWTLTYWIERHRLKNKRADVARIQSLRPNPSHMGSSSMSMPIGSSMNTSTSKSACGKARTKSIDRVSRPSISARINRRRTAIQSTTVACVSQ